MTYCPPDDHPIFVDGVALNTSGGGANGAVGVRIREITGWIGEGVDHRDTREPNTGRDGDRAGNSFLGGRTITFEGTITGSTYADLQDRKMTFVRTFARIATTEGVVKLPDPDTVAPSFTHADSMSGFERVEARLVGDGVTWGARFGLWGQWFQVSVRASDPLIYSDTQTTSSNGAAISYGGRERTPALITATIDMDVNNSSMLWDSADPSFPTIFVGDTGAVYHSTYEPQLVIDTKNRDAYLKVPHQKGRIGMMSPVALWPFSETVGATADNAEGTAAYDGTYVNTPTLNQTGPATGLVAAQFDSGSDEHVTVPYNSALYPSTEWTIEGWFKPTLSGGAGYILSFINAADTAGLVLRNSDENLMLFFQLAAGGAATGHDMAGHGVLSTVVAWHHVVITYRDGFVRMFLDGALCSAARKTFIRPGSGTLYFGRHIPVLGELHGSLSQWAIYGRAISDAEAEALYETGALFEAKAYSDSYIQSIVEWPMVTSGTQYNLAGDFGANNPSVVYREARL